MSMVKLSEEEFKKIMDDKHTMYVHCPECLVDIPHGTAMSDYASYHFAVSGDLLLIICKRHPCCVLGMRLAEQVAMKCEICDQEGVHNSIPDKKERILN